MDINSILIALLFVALIAVCIVAVVLILQLLKVLKSANATLDDVHEKLNPMLEDAQAMTTNIAPATAKIDPLLDRTLLTVDAINLELMRVDEILEDITKITDTASNASAAVDTITSAPAKAVSNMATRVREKLGGKTASEESAQLAEQRVAVAKALEDYKAAEGNESGAAPKAGSGDASTEDLLKDAAVSEAVSSSDAEGPVA